MTEKHRVAYLIRGRAEVAAALTKALEEYEAFVVALRQCMTKSSLNQLDNDISAWKTWNYKFLLVSFSEADIAKEFYFPFGVDGGPSTLQEDIEEAIGDLNYRATILRNTLKSLELHPEQPTSKKTSTGKKTGQDADSDRSHDRSPDSAKDSAKLDKRLSFAFGAGFLLLLLVVHIYIPNPSISQLTFFRTLLALSAAAFGIFIPGVLDVRASSFFRVGGAAGLFVLVYFFLPVGEPTPGIVPVNSATPNSGITRTPIVTPTSSIITLIPVTTPTTSNTITPSATPTPQLPSEPFILKLQDGQESAVSELDRRGQFIGGKQDQTFDFQLPAQARRIDFKHDIEKTGRAGGSASWVTDDKSDGRIQIHTWADLNGSVKITVHHVTATK